MLYYFGMGTIIVKIPTMVQNVGNTGSRVVVRGELNGETLFYNFLDDGDCVVESMRPGLKLVIELEENNK